VARTFITNSSVPYLGREKLKLGEASGEGPDPKLHLQLHPLAAAARHAGSKPEGYTVALFISLCLN